MLASWAEGLGRDRAGVRGRGCLRFVFYGRVSTEDWQDPVTSRARQREQAVTLVARARGDRGGVLRCGRVPDAGVGAAPAGRRAGRAAGRSGPGVGRGRDRGVRAGVLRQPVRVDGAAVRALRCPAVDAGGRRPGRLACRASREDDDWRWGCRPSGRSPGPGSGSGPRWPPRRGSRAGTWAAVRRTGTGSPTPGRTRTRRTRRGARRAHRLEPDPATAPVVRGCSPSGWPGTRVARITRALNDAGVPCPSAADPGRNPHRTGAAWTLRHGHGDPGEPPVHGPAGVEPAAHRHRPGRPGQHHARAQAGAAVEPARRAGSSPGIPRTRRWSARPTSSPRRTQPRRAARPQAGRAPPVPAGRAPRLRAVRAAAGISLVQRQARLPVPARPHQRDRPRTRPGRRTPTSARTRSCRTWPPCTSCSPVPPCEPGGAPGGTDVR